VNILSGYISLHRDLLSEGQRLAGWRGGWGEIERAQVGSLEDRALELLQSGHREGLELLLLAVDARASHGGLAGDEASEAALRAAVIAAELDDTDTAARLARDVDAAMAAAYGADAVERGAPLSVLVNVSDVEGEAVAVARELLRLARTHGQEEAEALCRLGEVAFGAEDTSTAREAWEEALTRYAPDSDEAIDVLGNLAVVYKVTGAADRAVTIERGVLSVRRERNGVTSPEALRAQHNLGLTLLALGSDAEGERMLREVLAQRLEDAGPTDDETQLTARALVSWYRDRDREDDAQAVVGQVVAGLRAMMGADGEE
jgi:tetratricopeptide (TPR) repeat protein